MYKTEKDLFPELGRCIYPRRCPGCGEVISPDAFICPECNTRFKRIQPPYCMRCGRHTESEDDELCSECASRNHAYTYGIAVFEYDELMRYSMSNFKFNGWRENADFYVHETTERAAERIRAFAPSVIVPVPIHSSKRAYRGFNQTELLADGIGQNLGIPVVKDLLLRARRTDAQKHLGLELRRANLKHAFTCDIGRYDRAYIEQHFERVLLLDDIYTTGATMENCTQALLAAGVAEVGILSISVGRMYY